MLLIVAAALIDAQGKVFVQRRRVDRQMGGLWEFPGGKLEPGESPESGLIRELKEELGIDVKLDRLIPAAFSTSPLKDDHLVLLLYTCRTWQGELQLLDVDEACWLPAAALRELEMPPADAPFIPVLIELTALAPSTVVL
jgi:8-oxo-dGTP diphosphatase